MKKFRYLALHLRSQIVQPAVILDDGVGGAAFPFQRFLPRLAAGEFLIVPVAFPSGASGPYIGGRLDEEDAVAPRVQFPFDQERGVNDDQGGVGGAKRFVEFVADDASHAGVNPIVKLFQFLRPVEDEACDPAAVGPSRSVENIFRPGVSDFGDDFG